MWQWPRCVFFLLIFVIVHVEEANNLEMPISAERKQWSLKKQRKKSLPRRRNQTTIILCQHAKRVKRASPTHVSQGSVESPHEAIIRFPNSQTQCSDVRQAKRGQGLPFTCVGIGFLPPWSAVSTESMWRVTESTATPKYQEVPSLVLWIGIRKAC